MCTNYKHIFKVVLVEMSKKKGLKKVSGEEKQRKNEKKKKYKNKAKCEGTRSHKR